MLSFGMMPRFPDDALSETENKAGRCSQDTNGMQPFSGGVVTRLPGAWVSPMNLAPNGAGRHPPEMPHVYERLGGVTSVARTMLVNVPVAWLFGAFDVLVGVCVANLLVAAWAAWWMRRATSPDRRLAR